MIFISIKWLHVEIVRVELSVFISCNSLSTVFMILIHLITLTQLFFSFYTNSFESVIRKGFKKKKIFKKYTNQLQSVTKKKDLCITNLNGSKNALTRFQNFSPLFSLEKQPKVFLLLKTKCCG